MPGWCERSFTWSTARTPSLRPLQRPPMTQEQPGTTPGTTQRVLGRTARQRSASLRPAKLLSWSHRASFDSTPRPLRGGDSPQRRDSPSPLSRVGACHARHRRPDQIIYADSASSDGSPDPAAALAARVVTVDAAGRPTAALGRNAGWRVASSDLILFLDGDTVLHPDFPRRAADALAANPSVAAVGGIDAELHPSVRLQCGAQFGLDLRGWIHRLLRRRRPHAAACPGGGGRVRRDAHRRRGAGALPAPARQGLPHPARRCADDGTRPGDDALSAILEAGRAHRICVRRGVQAFSRQR